MKIKHLRQLLRAVGPVALGALRRRQLIRPACTLVPPDPDILAEYDVRVPISDGFDVTVNVFRSKAAAARDEPMPVVMCAHPYDNGLLPVRGTTPLGGPPQQYRLIPQGGAPRFSTQTSWESPDPNFWVKSGYAVVNMNLPGYGSSGGPPSVFSEQQGKAYYEAIEWVAAQPWCDGNVGLNGVSFLAISQYHVAFCKAYGGPPPSLRCICPWEGVADPYRDLFRPGGVWEANFLVFWYYTEVLPAMNAPVEEFIAQEGSIPPDWIVEHSTRDAWVESKVPALERITVPTLLCATFSDQGIHTPGGFKAFMKIGAEDKWLYTHRWLKWDAYYSREVQELTLRFFDCFVRGRRDNGFLETPRVRVEVRAARDEVVEVRGAEAWPLPRTDYQRWYLDPGASRLVSEPPAQADEATYVAGKGQVVFRHRFERDTEITGHMALHVWVEVRRGARDDDDPSDMALAVAIDKRDASGESVRFFGAVGSHHDRVTRGYGRASMRAQTEASTEWLPDLSMRESEPLRTGQIVNLAIELNPHATVFRAGESLELLVAGHDLIPSAPLRKDLSDNRGVHVLHTGGERASYLLVPVIPRTSG